MKHFTSGNRVKYRIVMKSQPRSIGQKIRTKLTYLVCTTIRNKNFQKSQREAFWENKVSRPWTEINLSIPRANHRALITTISVTSNLIPSENITKNVDEKNFMAFSKAIKVTCGLLQYLPARFDLRIHIICRFCKLFTSSINPNKRLFNSLKVKNLVDTYNIILAYWHYNKKRTQFVHSGQLKGCDLVK